MDRAVMLTRIRDATTPWDILVVGGGATGLGTAIEAVARGYQTLLLEAYDFAKGTSSRSTKLVHGGVRYLRQGNVSLVLEALKERGLLRRNAPHLVHQLPFVVPAYDWWEGPFYGIGLKLYDLLAGRLGFGPSHRLSKEETLAYLPTLEPEGLRGGVIYYDGQFDDARLAVSMAQTAADCGGTLVNYMPVIGLLKTGEEVCGVAARDLESGETFEIAARVVVNATGVFTDDLRRMDDPAAAPLVRPSQGTHLVLDRSFLPGDTAIMVPQTDDGRVLFALPWHDRVLVGTTDVPVAHADPEPHATADEVAFLLSHAARYLVRDPAPADVRSVFAGLRPLVDAAGTDATAALSRDHTLHISGSGLVTITGGKWTTYRKMAEDTIDQAALLAGLPEHPSRTASMPLHGYHEHPETLGDLAVYGADAPALEAVLREDPRYAARLHPERPVLAGQVVWAVRHEMARTVEDVLARRTRTLLLDARTSIEMAPAVARIMAETLGRDAAWIDEQVTAYTQLAKGYLLT